MKHKQYRPVESQYKDTNAAMLTRLMVEKEAISKLFSNEIMKIEQNSRDYLVKISLEHEKATQLLEDERETLEELEKQLQQRGAVQNETERRELRLEKEKIEGATIELMKAHEEVLKLAEQQKKEREKLLKKVAELERKIDAKHALELEIERMKGALQVMKQTRNDEDTKTKKIMDKIRKELREKEEHLETMVEVMEDSNQAPCIKERKINHEMKDTCNEFVNLFPAFSMYS